MSSKKISIAIDGPSAAGKSTIAKKVAKDLSIEYIDTGAMYRALTLKILKLGIDPTKESDVIMAMKDTTIDFKNNHIYLDNINVDKEIRENIINNNVSNIAKIKEVRDGMVKIQQELGQEKSVVMDGRDIATVVLPHADFKFFITASLDERASRRYNELVQKENKSITLEEIKNEIENRDKIDSSRDISPLIKSIDAYELDTTDKSIEECVSKIISIIKGGK